MAQFHKKCGSLVKLTDDRRTAIRERSAHEFNNGIVLSADPLKDDAVFEVKIEKMITSWSGSIEIGVISSNVNNLEIPASATGFTQNSWILSGKSLLKNGQTFRHEYGTDLDSLMKGDRIGVMRSAQGALYFYINGECLGEAINYVPPFLYGVVDIYGKCVKVSIVDGFSQSIELLSSQLTNEALCRAAQDDSNEKLTFHQRCGSLIQYTNGKLTAERRRANDEFNNGVVMTNRPLKDNELFEIRIDKLVSKWSGSIEVGITTHDPSRLEFPATMTNMRSGTIMMSGCGILVNGKGTRREYGDHNLDDLKVGDRIGLRRKPSGVLHYYINGIDQGEATSNIAPTKVWGVVDLYGMTVKVTIVSEDSFEIPPRTRSVRTFISHPIPTRKPELRRQIRGDTIERSARLNNYNSIIRDSDFGYSPPSNDLLDNRQTESTNNENTNQQHIPLQFHEVHSSGAELGIDKRIAWRTDSYNKEAGAILFTNRQLQTDELFEIKIENIQEKWTDCLQIGVTTTNFDSGQFVENLLDITEESWMLTSAGFHINGEMVWENSEFISNLQIGDTIGLLRKENGDLSISICSVNCGKFASNVPENIYGIVNVKGQTARLRMLSESDNNEQLKFHHLHGKNARVKQNGKTAFRPNSLGEFNNAVVISNRTLRDNEIFEVIVENMMPRWSGSIEIGITKIPPENIDFPSTMTEINHDTWILSGSNIVKDGSTERNAYPLDLDNIVLKDRVGVSRTSSGELHFYLNGQDMGAAFKDVPPNVYAVIDLYGQCSQVTMTNEDEIIETNTDIGSRLEKQKMKLAWPIEKENSRVECFNAKCGNNIAMKNNGSTACRVRGFNNGLVFSNSHLKPNRLFEIVIESYNFDYSGSISIGLTTDNLKKELPDNIFGLKSDTWFVSQSNVYKNNTIIKENFLPSLSNLNDCLFTIGIYRTEFGQMKVILNGYDMGVVAIGLHEDVYGVLDLYGSSMEASLVKTLNNSALLQSLPESMPDEFNELDIESRGNDIEFHENVGKNAELFEKVIAKRVRSYNKACVGFSGPVVKEQLYQISINKVSKNWSSSLSIGLTTCPLKKITWPDDALKLKHNCWVIQGSCLYKNGLKIRNKIGLNLDLLEKGQVIGIKIKEDNCLYFYIDGIEISNIIHNLPPNLYLFVDMYGKCEEISLIKGKPNETKEKLDKSNCNKAMKKIFNCQFYQKCVSLKKYLCLPQSYFHQADSCFCENCYRKDVLYKLSGEPAKSYSLPVGWCRFPLKSTTNAARWHVAYYGTNLSLVRRILDEGDLCGEIEELCSTLNFNEEKNKPETDNIERYFLSPSINYATNFQFSPQSEYYDASNKTRRIVQVAFEVRIQPSSYSSGPPSYSYPIDSYFANNEIEWSTKEKGAVILTALLVKCK
ncbi:DgyrCDS1240 [Dimorphilus gyrociliatus]|uniref:DgyrCDS1240 n=1 Tax=Dimorphilus gyrociliatus TaxID=2664684 RepID=A0A7I8V6U2_9ANNE|nr:DgyrCDS1240 [Dimorphilus gyrociliatus]